MLLLAAASAAMAVEPITLNWENGTAFVPEGIKFEQPKYNAVTIVAELDWNAIDEAGKTEGAFLFTVNDAMNHNHGMCLYSGKTKHIDAWFNGADTYSALDFPLQYENGTDLISQSTHAVLLYTAYDILVYVEGKLVSTSYVWAQLYLSFDKGESYTLTHDMSQPKGWQDGDFGTITSFSYDSAYVSNIDVYNTCLEEKDVAAAIDHVTKGSSNSSIPEPTTATLSLLALAGLAARRRR